MEKGSGFSFDPKRSAVLSMDLQTGVVSVYVKEAGFIPRVAGVLERARAAGLPIVHVKVGFRPNVPEANPRNLFLSGIKGSPRHQEFFQGTSGAIHPALAPASSDLVVTKSRVSAFAGTDLDLLLRAQEIETLILFGIATSGVVLATFVAAFDGDYRLVVIKDCCADLDTELHQCLVDKYFPRLAAVITASEFQQALASASEAT
ncbi:MAG: isochorismatase family cysteine hydrolase [Candidatus Acidiferrum sp.]|jgi:nicotinamidase-related amidase